MRMGILNTTPGLERYPVIKHTLYMLKATGSLKHVQCYCHEIYKKRWLSAAAAARSGHTKQFRHNKGECADYSRNNSKDTNNLKSWQVM